MCFTFGKTGMFSIQKYVLDLPLQINMCSARKFGKFGPHFQASWQDYLSFLEAAEQMICKTLTV